MNLLDAMRYLSALAQARHFGRAAEACHITQPALSNAIRALEQEFGVTIVRRGRQYEGLTPEGERVLASAHRMLHEREALRQELGQARAAPGGPLLLACVPTALPVAARLVARLRAAHPALRPTLRSLSSPEIETGLEELSIDLALGYAERIEARGVRARVAASSRERHVLLRRRDPSARGRARRVAPLRWREAAALPLGLLTPEMHNRHIVDAAFAQAGVAVRPVFETNSVLALLLAVTEGAVAASIMPGVLAGQARRDAQLEIVPLVEPEVTVTMGLLVPQGGRLSLAQQAALGCVADAGWWRETVDLGGAETADAVDAAVHHSPALSGGSPT